MDAFPTLHLATDSSGRYNRLPPRVPPPSHRHAAPSAPWPWMDLDSDVDAAQLAAPHRSNAEVAQCDHTACGGCWARYPQALFPNWTREQVRRSGIADAVERDARGRPCVIHHVDVGDDGRFTDGVRYVVPDAEKEAFWEKIKGPQDRDGIRVRALFLENITGPVLQMIGTKYNIEPFFFSSSLKWIPSRYQEEVRPKEGDHITITLTFLRTMQNPMTVPPSLSSSQTSGTLEKGPLRVTQVIDTQAPLSLRSSSKILLLDLLSIHTIRRADSSTIISYHPTGDWRNTSAKRLHARVRFAGQSVYWQNIFEKSDDPTFVLLAITWHALYAWDEALEDLYAHICWLESYVLNTSDMQLTQELHIIRAHLLHYTSLLADFRKTVAFIAHTPNPAMAARSAAAQRESHELMQKECDNLLSEITRLEQSRMMQDKRLKNVMNLVFSSVNIEDSKRMQRLTEAAVRDSQAMKQISYLTMIFLPATFVAGVFGMNIREINPGTQGSLAHYFETALPLTLVTIWVIVAFQSKYYIGDGEASLWRRLWWPVTMSMRVLGRKGPAEEERVTGRVDEFEFR